ncbi:MAG: thiamine pyrophosphate-binding protein [Bacteroidetes bacterium]|nr:thiamine pyrophosphate-binding protein [Bacteroidota bacterium]
MRTADFIFNYLNETYSIQQAFLVTGGGAMFLNDALRKNENITCVFNHHEQACAIAAEGYFRTTGKICLVNPTTGPGSLNTLTGVMGQWTDSIPVIYISGQVKQETTIQSHPDVSLRQLGDQEVDIIEIVKPITKYAKTVTDPGSIKDEIDRAYTEMTTGRPGPVWLNIPIDVQNAAYTENGKSISPPVSIKNEDPIISESLKLAVSKLLNAKRPAIVIGHGLHISGGIDDLLEFAEECKIPLLTTFNGFDLVPTDHPCFIGRIGTLGSRPGNFCLQNADYLLELGTRNNIRQVSYNFGSFGKNAYKVVVDIDKNELAKKTLKPDLPICSDIKKFLDQFIPEMKQYSQLYAAWLDWNKIRYHKYPIVLNTHKNNSMLHHYVFAQEITRLLSPGDVLVAANGSACVSVFQAGIVNKGIKAFWNSGCASMGYALPAALGAAIDPESKNVICITGDGSIQMNIQELQTIKTYNLQVKIFLLNNGGYSSIKQTQDNFFAGNRFGSDKASGVEFPDCIKLAKAYDYPYYRVTSENLDDLHTILHKKGEAFVEVILDPEASFEPKLSSKQLANGNIVSSELEDLYPFLSDEELASNMIEEELAE